MNITNNKNNKTSGFTLNINSLIVLSIIILISNIIAEININVIFRVVLIIFLGIGAKYLQPQILKISGKFGESIINNILFFVLLSFICFIFAFLIEF